MMSSPLKALIQRTLVAKFEISSPPKSLSESLEAYSTLSKLIGDSGRIIHYRQSMCPVTKERLQNLNLLIEDLHRTTEDPRTHVFWDGKEMLKKGQRTTLEEQLLTARDEVEISNTDSRVVLRGLTRDEKEIERLNGAPKTAGDETETKM